MKIALSITFDLSDSNGTTVRAQNMFNLLSQKFDTFLIERADDEADSNNIITIKPKGTKLWNLKLIPVILKSKPDCVICVNDYAGFMTFYLLSKIYKYRIIFDAHSIYSAQYDNASSRIERALFLPIASWIERFIIRHSTHVIAASTVAGNFHKQFNDDVLVITHFVNEDQFHVTETALERKQSRHHKLIGLIGPYDSLRKLKELGFLFEHLCEFDERLEFVVIGHCLKQIHKERIHYTGYVKELHDYVDHIGALDAALILQDEENYGPLTRVLEPMACSVPVFTVPNAVKGLDTVRNGCDLFVFQPNELVAGINTHIFNDELLTRVGANARKYVENSYSKKANEGKLLAMLGQLDAGR
jgi:glycosyltransferase involved in cell wall biosynthesis